MISERCAWARKLILPSYSTSMVAFAAMYTIQSISRATSLPMDSTYFQFRLDTLQVLVAELERQAAERHPVDNRDSLNSVDAMAKQVARGIRVMLKRMPGWPPGRFPERLPERPPEREIANAEVNAPGESRPLDELTGLGQLPPDQALSAMDMLENDFVWDTINIPDLPGLPIFDFDQCVASSPAGRLAPGA